MDDDQHRLWMPMGSHISSDTSGITWYIQAPPSNFVGSFFIVVSNNVKLIFLHFVRAHVTEWERLTESERVWEMVQFIDTWSEQKFCVISKIIEKCSCDYFRCKEFLMCNVCFGNTYFESVVVVKPIICDWLLQNVILYSGN